MQTPLWVPLVVAGMGFIAAISAALLGAQITQRRSDAREAAQWERERERERERWKREDEARTFEHRREVYVAYFETIKRMANLVDLASQERSGNYVLPDDWWRPAFDSLNQLIVYGTSTVAEAAGAAYACARVMGDELRLKGRSERCKALGIKYGELESDLLHKIREDMQIPGGRLTVVS